MLTAQPQSRAWREIDLEALTHNARVLQASLAPGCRLMAVVKADAYGHGAAQAALRLRRAGVASFAVACLDEAVSLRQQGLEEALLILGYTPPEEAAALARWNLVQAVADEAHAAALAAQGIPLRVHLALDTGMHRLGIPADDHAAIARVWELPNLTVEGVFSHLCVSDSPQPEARSYTHDQVERFFAGRIFGDTCFALGFDMDGGQSLARAVPGEPHLFSDSRIFASCVDRLDIQTLGNAIFSRWRQWTHWDECSLDEDGWAWFVTALEHLAQLTGEEDGTPCGEKEEE